MKNTWHIPQTNVVYSCFYGWYIEFRFNILLLFEQRIDGVVACERDSYICMNIDRDVYMNLSLAHSGQMILSSSVMKPRPTKLVEQLAQMKQSLCQWRSSKEMNRVPPIPVIGSVQAVQRLANSLPKQSAQHGLSSRLVKRWPAKFLLQWVHVKHSLCHGSFL